MIADYPNLISTGQYNHLHFPELWMHSSFVFHILVYSTVWPPGRDIDGGQGGAQIIQNMDNLFSSWMSQNPKCGLFSFASQVEMSPLENAIEVLENKNQQLKTLISQCQTRQMQNINPLTMCLNGVIDAAVNGGVSRYQEVRIQCCCLKVFKWGQLGGPVSCVCLLLRSWSQGPGIKPSVGLPVQRGACFSLSHCLFPLLVLSFAYLSLSFSLSNK